MSDNELLNQVSDQISNLARTGGRSHKMTVPVRIDDTDMLFSELLRRYKQARVVKKERDELKKELAELRDGTLNWKEARGPHPKDPSDPPNPYHIDQSAVDNNTVTSNFFQGKLEGWATSNWRMSTLSFEKDYDKLKKERDELKSLLNHFEKKAYHFDNKYIRLMPRWLCGD